MQYEVQGDNRHVARIAEMRNTYKILVNKLKGKNTS